MASVEMFDRVGRDNVGQRCRQGNDFCQAPSGRGKWW